MASGGFISDTVTLSVSNIASSAFNYGFLVAAAFILSSQEFGILNTAIGILTLLTTVGNVIQLEVTSVMASTSIAPQLLAKLYLRRSVRWLAAPLAACLVFSESLAHLLNVDWQVIILLNITCTALIASCVANGITCGLRKLRLQASIAIYSSLGKLGSGLLMFWCGWGAKGGIVACALGYFIVYEGSLKSRALNSQPHADSDETKLSIPAASLNTIKLIAIYGLLIAPFVSDQILVQHYNTALSGMYGALGILGKLLFFLSAPILSAVYSHACSEKDGQKRRVLFTRALALIALLSVVFLSMWLLLGNFFGPLALPSRYHDALPHIPAMIVGTAFFCVSYLLILWALVRSDFRATLFLVPALVLQAVLYSQHHDNLSHIVYNQILTFSVQLISIVLSIWTLRPSQSVIPIKGVM